VPEILEVEAYRRLSDQVVDRPIRSVVADDAWYLKGGLTADALAASLEGERFVASRRVGKVLLLDTSAASTIGLRFGMTGRLLVDGRPAIEHLQYASRRDDPAWDRLVITFDSLGELRLRDPRRLGGVELHPDESVLGTDAFEITVAVLARAVAGRAPLKARLLDQRRIAGIGNLLADETLWRAGLDPARPGDRLSRAEIRRLHRHLRATLAELGRRGGSHTGDLQEQRRVGGLCPRDGSVLLRRRVGGRTTYSCPEHQR
jgi:formamidopyrimidine-DNA glycosylase